MRLHFAILLILALQLGCGAGGRSSGGGDPIAAALGKQGQRLAAALKSLELSFQLDKSNQLVSAYLTDPDLNDDSIVKLTDHRQIRNLSLAGTKITDAACETIGQLTELESLDLSHTKVTAAGIAQLDKLTKLKMLNLQATSFADDGLMALGRLSMLSDLNLAGTLVSDAGLVDFPDISTLQYLDLSQTKTTPAGIAELRQRIQQLRQVRYDRPLDKSSPGPVRPGLVRRKTPANTERPRNNRTAAARTNSTSPTPNRRPATAARVSGLAGDVQDELMEDMLIQADSGLPGLISPTPSKGSLLSELNGRRSLSEALLSRALDRSWDQLLEREDGQTEIWLCFGSLSGNTISIAGLQKLAQQPHLCIDLHESRLAPEFFQALSQCSNLRSLRLTQTNTNDTSLEQLKTLSKLEELGLGGTEISDAGMQSLVGLKKLRRLWVADTRISDEGLKHIAQLPDLEELDLRATAVTDLGMATLAKLPSLRRLNLANTDVTPAAVEAFRQQHPQCLVAHP